MPVFDGLFPGTHNRAIQELLFTCAHWHGLAKLRMHTDATLEILDSTTVILGKQLRHFAQVICLKYNTRELPKEADARDRKASKDKDPNRPVKASSTRRPKVYKINTYKHHSLGDYVDAIKMYGTCDSFNTELVRLNI